MDLGQLGETIMAVDRYANIDVTKERTTGKRNYRTAIFPEIPESDSDLYIVTRDGDRLDIISNRFYQDTTLWWIIAAANKLSDSLFITPGTRLRIPTDIQSVLSYINTVNNTR